ncbi:hypothetical protein EB796_022845 [Bugula neritina]|uniref:Endoplasmic reticulum transmembrane protein n=1 Tax=Bugula neritina TaxID=10212 RepID=A0A7J7IY44_BUGNE|nr:hypothetical protein EB796_022845 [Bugula neritina]
MSLQWTAITGFLYFEMAIIFLLLLPFISAASWQRVFNSGLVRMAGLYANYYFTMAMVLLGICFADSIREMVKYTHSDKAEASMANNPNTVDHIHMKLFRAQRNFYIAGFSLFLWFVLHRLVTLISTEAKLFAGKEAAIKQAKSASEAAQRLMSQQEKGDDSSNDKNELAELREKLSETKSTLRAKEADLEAMKKQAESTNREYDRLSEDFQRLQQELDSSSDKKTS